MRPASQVLARFVLAMPLLLGAAAAPAAEPPRVVASIGPIGDLAAMVMRDVGTPTVLLPAGASPHAYALRPSEARTLAQADLVLWVGEALESFLEEPLETLAKPASVVELIEATGLVLHPARAGGIWDAGHDDDHGHGHGTKEGHSDHARVDPHLWLDPGNAAALVDAIAVALAERDPRRAAAYRVNAEHARSELAALDRDIAATLAPVRERPYVVFHDAYQYLERHYGLTPVGAVTIGPERGAGAQRLTRLRDEIRRRGATCAFREPQFAPRVLESLAGDTGIRVGILDPIGGANEPSADGYGRLMRGLAGALVECLGRAG